MAKMVIQKHRPGALRAVDAARKIGPQECQLSPLISQSLRTPRAFHSKHLRRPEHGPDRKPGASADLPILPRHRYGIDVAKTNTSGLQTESNSMYRQGCDMLDPNKPFFLGGGNDSAVFD